MRTPFTHIQALFTHAVALRNPGIMLDSLNQLQVCLHKTVQLKAACVPRPLQPSASAAINQSDAQMVPLASLHWPSMVVLLFFTPTLHVKDGQTIWMHG